MSVHTRLFVHCFAIYVATARQPTPFYSFYPALLPLCSPSQSPSRYVLCAFHKTRLRRPPCPHRTGAQTIVKRLWRIGGCLHYFTHLSPNMGTPIDDAKLTNELGWNEWTVFLLCFVHRRFVKYSHFPSRNRGHSISLLISFARKIPRYGFIQNSFAPRMIVSKTLCRCEIAFCQFW